MSKDNWFCQQFSLHLTALSHVTPHTWWRHQMETFSVLLAICVGNSPVPGELTGPRWIPRTKASAAELWCFVWSTPEWRLSKQSWGWWFETPSRILWCHSNAFITATEMELLKLISFSVKEIFILQKYLLGSLYQSISYWWVSLQLSCSAALTPAKYEIDIQQVTTVLTMVRNWENSRMEEIVLVTLHYLMVISQEIQNWLVIQIPGGLSVNVFKFIIQWWVIGCSRQPGWTPSGGEPCRRQAGNRGTEGMVVTERQCDTSRHGLCC